MISRRKVLEGSTLAALAAVAPFKFSRKAFGQSASSFDYYISPQGDDNNSGTLESPWSITALNSKMSAYAGKRIGVIGDKGVINTGRVGGVATTLYSIYQALPGNGSGGVLLLNGGATSSQPTYIASCDSSGVYSPRLAIIDAADPSSGAQPTVQGPFIAQNQYQSSVQVQNYGNVTVDGLIVRNFTFSGLHFAGGGSTPVNGLVIQNCEIYNQQNVISNNNPGAIWLNFANNAVIQNCCIHDLKTNGAGTSYQMQACGVITFHSFGTKVTSSTFYRCCALSTKDGWQQMDVSYCYLGWGVFGSPYSHSASTTNLGGAIHNYLTGKGSTNHFHHNILLGPVLCWGESSQENEGLVMIYNNTFYEPSGSGYSRICAVDNEKGNAGGTWSFYNNLVYSEVGYENGDYFPGALTMYEANILPSIFAICDHNAYGSGMTFGGKWGINNLPLSAWKLFGFDTHSTTLTASPFTGTPAEADSSSFQIARTAQTAAGVGGALCGALDGTGLVGCDFTGQAVPNAPSLAIS